MSRNATFPVELPIELSASLILDSALAGGKNNRIFFGKLDSRPVVLKCYLQNPGDERNRLRAEFGALDFLWRHGVRCIPEPIAMFSRESCAVYGFLDGEKLPAAEVDSAQIKQFAAFAGLLRALSREAGAAGLAAASEASFCLSELKQNIDLRFRRLENGADQESEAGRALHSFLNGNLRPFFHESAAAAAAAMQAKSSSFVVSELSLKERTLSPSDFGVHNAIRRASGEWCFLDFEYFGWDDPAKLIADFLLHPGMQLSDAQRQSFLNGVLPYFAEDVALRSRLLGVYPLYAVKWSLIILNEFLPENIRRRQFADPSLCDSDKLKARQQQQLVNAVNFVDGAKSAQEKLEVWLR